VFKAFSYSIGNVVRNKFILFLVIPDYFSTCFVEKIH